jgi:hypothetical protein
MSVLRDIGKIMRVTYRGGRGVARGVKGDRDRRHDGVALGRPQRRYRPPARRPRQRRHDAPARSARGLVRGDTLITIGLAGTIFFGVPTGEARGRVALYLLVTMVPFALLAPVVGPCSTGSATAAATPWPPPCWAGPCWPG